MRWHTHGSSAPEAEAGWLRVWGRINLYRLRWTIGRHWLKTKQNLGVITIIKINYNKQTVIISVVSAKARSCMHGRLRETQSWILVWTSSFPHGGGNLSFILPHTKKSCCLHPLQSSSQGGRFLRYQELRDPVQRTVEGLGFPPCWLPRGLAVLPANVCVSLLSSRIPLQGCQDPPRGNLLPVKLYWYSEGKGSAKNNFPRQSEQIILMRVWKWETNDTKLALLSLVNCVVKASAFAWLSSEWV